MKMKKELIVLSNNALLLIIVSIGIIVTGCASTPKGEGQASGPVLGPPTLLQQALNLLPAVPIAGNNLKFQFGGDAWIATNNGANFIGGTFKIHDSGEGVYILVNQTHIYSNRQKPLVGGAIGWIRTPGPEIILFKNEEPSSSFSLVSRSNVPADIIAALDAAVPSAPQTPGQPALAGTPVQTPAQIPAAARSNADDFAAQIINGGTSARITGYEGTDTAVIIPPRIGSLPVTEIGQLAFMGKGLTSVVIPGSVTGIASMAFAGNPLSAVTLGNNVNIASDAFDAAFSREYNSRGSAAGTYVSGWGLAAPAQPVGASGSADDFAAQIINGGTSARITGYEGRDAEIRIPPRIGSLPVTEIGQRAFMGKGLTSVVIPDSVTSIAGMAFAENRLSSVTIGANVNAANDAFDAAFNGAYNGQGRRPGTYTYSSDWRLVPAGTYPQLIAEAPPLPREDAENMLSGQPYQNGPAEPVVGDDAWKRKWFYLGGVVGGGSYRNQDTRYYSSIDAGAGLFTFGAVADLALFPFLSLETDLFFCLGKEGRILLPLLAKLGGRIGQIELFPLTGAIPRALAVLSAARLGSTWGRVFCLRNFYSLMGLSRYKDIPTLTIAVFTTTRTAMLPCFLRVIRLGGETSGSRRAFFSP
jgi:hypothetical protein